MADEPIRYYSKGKLWTKEQLIKGGLKEDEIVKLQQWTYSNGTYTPAQKAQEESQQTTQQSAYQKATARPEQPEGTTAPVSGQPAGQTQKQYITEPKKSGKSPEIMVGGRKGHFNFDVPPEEGGTPGKRYAFDTEDGGRWFLQLEKEYQGGRWEEGEGFKEEYEDLLKKSKTDPTFADEYAEEHWGKTDPLTKITANALKTGKTLAEFKETVKPYNTHRQISGDPIQDPQQRNEEYLAATNVKNRQDILDPVDFNVPAQQFDDGNFTYQRYNNGKILVKPKNSETWLDLDERSKTNPEAKKKADEVRTQFDTKFGKIPTWEERVNMRLSLEEAQYQGSTEMLDKKIKELNKKESELTLRPAGFIVKHEEKQKYEADLNAIVKERQDLITLKGQLEKSYNGPKTFAEHAKYMVHDVERATGKSYADDPIGAASIKYEVNENYILTKLQPNDKEEYKLNSKYNDLQKKIDQADLEMEALKGQKDAAGKPVSTDAVTKKLDALKEEQRLIAGQANVYRQQRKATIDQEIADKQAQANKEDDEAKRNALLGEVSGMESVRGAIFIGAEQQTMNVLEQEKPGLLKIADLLPKDGTPQEILNFYLQTLIAERDLLADDIIVGKNWAQRGWANTVASMFGNDKYERLYGYNGLEAKIKAIAPLVAMNRLPIDVVTGKQKQNRNTLDKIIGPDSYLGKINLRTGQELNIYAQTEYQTPQQEATTIESVLDETGLASKVKADAEYLIMNRATPKDWSPDDVGNMVAPTLAMLPSFALGGVAVGAVQKIIPVLRLVEGVKTAQALRLAKLTAAGNKLSKAKRVLAAGERFAAATTEQGLTYEATGQIFGGRETVKGEADFASGFLGEMGVQVISKLGKKSLFLAPMIAKVLGKKTGAFIRNLEKYAKGELKEAALAKAEGITKKIATPFGSAIGESTEEFGQTTWQLYRDSETAADFDKQFDQQFGSGHERFKFFAQTALMGMFFRGASDMGKTVTKQVQDRYKGIIQSSKSEAATKFAVDYFARFHANAFAEDVGARTDSELGTIFQIYENQADQVSKDPESMKKRNAVVKEMNKRGIDKTEAKAVAETEELIYVRDMLLSKGNKGAAAKVDKEIKKAQETIELKRLNREGRNAEITIDKNIRELQKKARMVPNPLEDMAEEPSLVANEIVKGNNPEIERSLTALNDISAAYTELQKLKLDPARENTRGQIGVAQKILFDHAKIIADHITKNVTDSKRSMGANATDLINTLQTYETGRIKVEAQRKTQEDLLKEKKKKVVKKEEEKGKGKVPEDFSDDTPPGTTQEEIDEITKPQEKQPTPKEKYIAKQKEAKKINKEIVDLQAEIETERFNIEALQSATKVPNQATLEAKQKIIEENTKAIEDLQKSLPNLPREQQTMLKELITEADKQGYEHVKSEKKGEDLWLKGREAEGKKQAREGIKEGDILDIEFKERKDFTEEEKGYKNTTNRTKGYEYIIRAVKGKETLGGPRAGSVLEAKIVELIRSGEKPKLLVVNAPGSGSLQVYLVKEKSPEVKATEDVVEKAVKKYGTLTDTEKIEYEKNVLRNAAKNLKSIAKGTFMPWKSDSNLDSLGLVSNEFRTNLGIQLLAVAESGVRIGLIKGSEIINYCAEWMKSNGFGHHLNLLVQMTPWILETIGVVNDIRRKSRYKMKQQMEFYTSQEEKFRALRDVFSDLFGSMQKHGMKEPERDIYWLCKNEEFLKSTRNEETCFNYVATVLAKENPLLAEILANDEIIKYSEIISLKNFYSNLELLESKSIIQSGDDTTIHNINKNDRTVEFDHLIKATLRSFTVPGITTNPGLALRSATNTYLGRENDSLEAKILQKYAGKISKEDQQKKIAELIVVYSEYLELITGIPQSIWAGYFNPQNEKDFMAGDVEQAKITYYLKKNRIDVGSPSEVVNNVITHFTVPVAKSQSNLQKLINTAIDKEAIGLSFNGVTGNKETSFEQMSDLLISARNVVEKLKNDFYKDNPILLHHKESGRIQLVKLNGIANLDADKKVEASELSNEDIVFSQLVLFKQSGKKYLHALGQFGDKKQMYFIEVPRYADPKRTYEELLKSSPYGSLMAPVAKLEKEIRMVMEIGANNSMAFRDEWATQESRRKFAESFVYNFAVNKYYSDLIFHGRLDQYKMKGKPSFTMLVKRAGSTNSPGYIPDLHIEGGIGEFQNHLILNEPLSALLDEPEFEWLNGVQFMTREFADKLMVSMGSVFSREDEFNKLNNTKALYSITHNNGMRGLTKSNIVVIDEIAEAFPGSIYDNIRKLMERSKADTCSFPSGTKYADGPITEVFVNGKFVMPKETPETFKRSNGNFLIQQDLRHDITPEFRKQPIQTIANFIHFKNAEEITRLWNKIQEMAIIESEAELANATPEQLRDSLLELIDKEQLSELHAYIKAGGTGSNPYFDGLVIKIKASFLRRTILERKVNRVALQEIPVGDVDLKPPRKSADGKHLLLAECACNIEGIRYMTDSPVFENIEDLSTYVREKDYVDMYHMEDGKKVLNDWEVIEQDGLYYIPGEPLLITRVPADDVHSHTIARAKFKIPFAGNVIMTDAESQYIAGSDNDGDKRFVESLVKNKDGKAPINETSINGMLNKSLLLLIGEYRKPSNFARIREQIALKKYDRIIDKRTKDFQEMHHNSVFDNLTVHSQNYVGRKVIGITAKLSTSFDYIKRLNIKLNIEKPFKIGQFMINNFTTDKYGLFKHHIGNLLNLALDNAKDPKIEILGYNEITTSMFITALITDSSIDNLSKTEQEAAIVKRIEQISDLFSTSIGREFIRLERQRKKASSTDSINETWQALMTQDAVKTAQLQRLYYISRDINTLTDFIDISREIPDTIDDFRKARAAMISVRKNRLRNMDTSQVYPNGVISPFIKGAEVSFALAVKHVFGRHYESSADYDIVESEVFGVANDDTLHEDQGGEDGSDQQGRQKETNYYQKKLSFRKMIRKLIALKALSNGRTIANQFTAIKKAIEEDQKNEIQNKFLSFIQVVLIGKTEQRIEILNKFRRSVIPDIMLKEIQDDFNKLPDGLKKDLLMHSIHHFGLSISSWGGNYSKLFSPEYMVEIDNMTSGDFGSMVQNEYPYKEFLISQLKNLFAKPISIWNRYVFDINLRASLVPMFITRIEGYLKEGLNETEILNALRDSAAATSHNRSLEELNKLIVEAEGKGVDLLSHLKEIITRTENSYKEDTERIQQQFKNLPAIQIVDNAGSSFVNYEKETNTIIVKAGITVDNFFEHITSNETLKKAFEYLANIGYTEAALRSIITTNEQATALFAYTGLGHLISKDYINETLQEKITTEPLAFSVVRSEFYAALFAIKKIEEQGTYAPSQYTNHSGGADGSDSVWFEFGQQYGVLDQRHYHHELEPNAVQNIKISEQEFVEGKKHVNQANETLGRQPDKHMDKLARNWYQVLNADEIFAVGDILSGNIVDGGTGWAVQMAIDNGKPVHFFDQKTKHWYNYNYQTEQFEKSGVPVLTKEFAGVGTRQISKEGRQAINNVYRKTFFSQMNQPQVVPRARISMKFADGSGGRRMSALNRGYSTMNLIRMGRRTGTSRDMSKDYNQVDLQEGDVVEFYDDNDNTVLVRVTSGFQPVENISKKEWSEAEGWHANEHDRLVKEGNYQQFRFELLKSVPKETEVIEQAEETLPGPAPAQINIYSTDKNGFEKLSNILNGPFKAIIHSLAITFSSVEQYYQYQKAIFAGDNETAQKILNAKTGWDAVRLSKEITGLDSKKWDAEAERILEHGIRLAIDQNESARNLLLSTGEALLTHTKEGIRLGKWEKAFPEILMRIRSEIKKYGTPFGGEIQIKAKEEPVVPVATDQDEGILNMRTVPINYTNDQRTALLKISSFLNDTSKKFFLLAGFAGTGKTTIIENIAKYSSDFRDTIILSLTNSSIVRINEVLAPTNTAVPTSTIHSFLYGHPDEDTGRWIPADLTAYIGSTIIVDEVQIVDSELLQDLIDAAKENNFKIVFIGDSFQLQPIKNDPKLFNWLFPWAGKEDNYTMQEVVRQSEGSLLAAATFIRAKMKPIMPVTNTEEISRVTESELNEQYHQALKDGEDTIMVVSTNPVRKQANQNARNAIHPQAKDNVLVNGERLISIANNGGLVNGDKIEVIGEPKMFGTTSEVESVPSIMKSGIITVNMGTRLEPRLVKMKLDVVRVLINNDSKNPRTILLLSDTEEPSVYPGQLVSSLYNGENRDLILPFTERIKTREGGSKTILKNNLIIATYGYAITAHKSMGSQWAKVFLNIGWLSPKWNHARWLYTAVTRAVSKLIYSTSEKNYIRNEDSGDPNDLDTGGMGRVRQHRSDYGSEITDAPVEDIRRWYGLDTYFTNSFQQAEELAQMLRESYKDLIVWIADTANGKQVRIERNLNRAKQGTTNNNVGELLATSDAKTRDHVLKKMREMYPGVHIFNDYAEFERFVIDHFGSMGDMDMNTFGAAFNNAIYINPTSARQSTLFHEFAHIYWGLLPNNHPVKAKLIKHFGSEEQAVIAIGLKGYEMALIDLQGTFFEKAEQFLIEFWAAVRALFGADRPGDMATVMAKHIWHNKDMVMPSDSIRRAIRYHKDDRTGINVEDNHVYTGTDGKTRLISVTQVVTSLQEGQFDPRRIARQALQKEKKERYEQGLTALTGEEETDRMSDLIKEWERKTERGTSIHNIMEIMGLGGRVSDIPKSVKDQFAPGVFDKMIEDAREYSRTVLNPRGEREIHEEVVADEENYLAGKIDLQIEHEPTADSPDGAITIIDFKTSDKRLWNGDKLADDYITPFRDKRLRKPFSHISDTKFNHHAIQVGLYRRMKVKEGKKIRGAHIAPIYYETDENGLITKVEFEKLVLLPNPVKQLNKIIAFNAQEQKSQQAEQLIYDDEVLKDRSSLALDQQRRAIVKLNAFLAPGETLGTLSVETAETMFHNGGMYMDDFLQDFLGFTAEQIDNMSVYTAIYHYVNNEAAPKGITNEYNKEEPTGAIKVVLDKIGTVSGLQNLDLEDLLYYENWIRDFADDKSRMVYKYIVAQISKHILVSKIRNENHVDQNTGKSNKEFKLATCIMYELVTNTYKAKADLFQGNWLMRQMMTDRFMPNDFKMVQLYQNIVREQGNKVFHSITRLMKDMKDAKKGVDFDKITVSTGGMDYFMNPYDLDEDHGLSNKEIQYLRLIYQYYNTFNTKFKREYAWNQEHGLPPPSIPIPYAHEPWSQALAQSIFHLKGNRAFVLRKLMKPEAFDFMEVEQLATEIDETGANVETMKLVQFATIKKMFDLENGDIDLLREAYNTAKKKFKDEVHSSSKNIVRKRVAIKFDSREKYVKIAHHNKAGVVTEHLKSMIVKHHMEKVIPFHEYLKEDVYSPEANGQSVTFNKLRDYLDKFTNKRVYGKKGKMERLERFMNFAMMGVAFKSLAINATAQLINFLIGQTNNLVILGPVKFSRGLVRLAFYGPRVLHILNNLEIVDVTHEHGFSSTQNFMRKLTKGMFFMTEAVEKTNHGIAVAGAMSSKQFEAFKGINYKTNIGQVISAQERARIEDIVRKIHGDYGEKNTVAAGFDTFGQAFMQFRRWIPAMVIAHFGSAYIDRNGIMQRGFMISGVIYFNVLCYNYLKNKKGKERIYEKYKLPPEDSDAFTDMSDSAKLKWMRFYVDQAKAGHINFADFDESDKVNLAIFFRQMTLVAGTLAYVLSQVLGPEDDEEDPITKRFNQWLKKTISQRLTGDILFFENPSNIVYMLSNPVAAFGWLVSISEVIMSALGLLAGMESARYKSNTIYGAKGEPKVINKLVRTLPGGSFMYQAKTLRTALNPPETENNSGSGENAWKNSNFDKNNKSGKNKWKNDDTEKSSSSGKNKNKWK